MKTGEMKSMGDICEVSDEKWERVEVMVDSGATDNAGPQSVGQGLDVKPKSGVNDWSMLPHGQRPPHCQSMR